MTTPAVTIRGSSSHDLLAIPAIVLGFQPEESCVVVGFEGRRVRFCARIDLGWLAAEVQSVAAQVLNAHDNFEQCDFAILGYSADPEGAAELMADLLAVLGEDVREVFVSNGERYWHLGHGGLEPPDGIPWDLSECSLAAQAVYHGLNVSGVRQDAVREVLPPPPAVVVAAETHIDDALALLGSQDAAQQLEELRRLLGCDTALTAAEAARLAVLLDVPDHLGEVLTQLSVASAARIRPRLAEARQSCDRWLAPNVVALLGMACWLDGEGAQVTECMAQLDILAPDHPVFALLRRLHASAVPPSRWDE